MPLLLTIQTTLTRFYLPLTCASLLWFLFSAKIQDTPPSVIELFLPFLACLLAWLTRFSKRFFTLWTFSGLTMRHYGRLRSQDFHHSSCANSVSVMLLSCLSCFVEVGLQLLTSHGVSDAPVWHSQAHSLGSDSNIYRFQSLCIKCSGSVCS